MLTSTPVNRLLAPYSEGFRLAAEHGARSELVFEYACDNRAQGRGWLGRWLDHAFLCVAAAQALRRRVDAKKDLVVSLIAERQRRGASETTIFDLASGTGRHLRELVRDSYGATVSVVCHDRDPRKVMQGREFIARDGIGNITFAVGDATDPASYLIVDQPDIVLAWGLFPRLLRDDAVRSVMRLAFEHMAPGGKFACTTARLRDRATGRWEGPLALRTVDRDPDQVAGWLRATGFADPVAGVNTAAARVLVATKPDTA